MGKRALSYEDAAFLHREIKPRHCSHALAATLEEGHTPTTLPLPDALSTVLCQEKIRLGFFGAGDCRVVNAGSCPEDVPLITLMALYDLLDQERTARTARVEETGRTGRIS